MGEYQSPGELAHKEMEATKARTTQIAEAKTPAQMVDVAQKLYGVDLNGAPADHEKAMQTLLADKNMRAQGAELANLMMAYHEAKKNDKAEKPPEQQYQQAA